MNKKGFTIVEVMAVIVVMSLVLVISIPIVSKSGHNTKMNTLESKIANIEKSAILYIQQNPGLLTFNDSTCTLCAGITNNCYCVSSTSPDITVYTLADKNAIKFDDETTRLVLNPTSSKNIDINDCKIQLYKKYNKIYAYYEGRVLKDKTMEQINASSDLLSIYNDGCWDASKL